MAEQFLGKAGTQVLIDAIRKKIESSDLETIPIQQVNYGKRVILISDDDEEISDGYFISSVTSISDFKGYYYSGNSSYTVGDFGETEEPSI